MRKIVMITAAALCLAACNESGMTPVVALGGKPKVVVLPNAGSGQGFFDVITNVDYSAEVVKGGEWLSINRFDDVVVVFDYFANTGFAREARIALSCRERRDTVSIRQEGVYVPFVSLSQTRLDAPSEGGLYDVDISSNVPCACLEAVSSEPGIVVPHIRNNRLEVSVKPTTKKDTKKYEVTVRFINDWGEPTVAVLSVVQEALK